MVRCISRLRLAGRARRSRHPDLNEEIRRYVDADTRQCTQPWIDKVVNLILNVTPGQSELSGTWSIIDPRANQPFATVELAPDGSFKGGGFPPSLGGPNGLGANQYRFENGVLKFIYIQPGRPRIDEMLVGSVRKVSDMNLRLRSLAVITEVRIGT